VAAAYFSGALFSGAGVSFSKSSCTHSFFSGLERLGSACDPSTGKSCLVWNQSI